jgi:hypothetical protein
MSSRRLKTLTVGVVATLIIVLSGSVLLLAQGLIPFPTKTNPLVIDAPNKRVLLYTEINTKNIDKANPHWCVVFQGGKLKDKAILNAFCTPEEFHDALIQIGAKPGNYLTFRSSGETIQGDELAVTVTLAGLAKNVGLADLIEDSSGKGIRIRFGGNRQRAVKEQTGCITCLESCPIGITSNASYPAISSFKRLLSPNSQFKLRSEKIPRQGGIILIYSLGKSPPKEAQRTVQGLPVNP